MAYRRRHHHRHHRHNPFGISGGVVKEAAWVAAGAVASSALPGAVLPKQNVGWTGVALTAGAAVLSSFVARMIGGGTAAAEALKGGLAAAVIRAVHEAGFAKNLGLGLYAPSWFGVPTSSSQYLQAAAANIGPYRRGAGTIFFPGPGGSMIPAQPATVSGIGYHRFRSRYQGGYG